MNKSALCLCGFLLFGILYAEEEVAQIEELAQTNVYYPQQGTGYSQQGTAYPQQGVVYPQQGTAYPQQTQRSASLRSNYKQDVEQKWRDYQNYNVGPNPSNASYYPTQTYNYYQNYTVPAPAQTAVYPNVNSPQAYPSGTPVYTNPAGAPVYTNPAGAPVYTNPTGTPGYVNPNAPTYTTPQGGGYVNPNTPPAYPSNVVAPPNQGAVYHPTYAPPPGGYGIGPNQQQGAILRNFDQLRNTTINSNQGSYQPTGQMTQSDRVKYRAVKQQEELMKRQLKQQEGLNR